MADPLPLASPATPLPTPADIARAERFPRERFVHEGEDPAVALAPGSARRRALDDALAEIARGAEHPSTEWRRTFSLLLGLERVLSEEEPRLVDGTLLSPHQVDALSGTLTALLAEAQRNGNGNGYGNGQGPLPPAASSAMPGEEEFDGEVPDDEEPVDWEDPLLADEEEAQLPEAPEDPNAHKRFGFEHATGAGKSVAALGFVEATRTGGVLILTHRRNLVDQFTGELRDRGYRDRITAPLMKGQDRANGPVTVETYQWFVRNAGQISSAYTIVICDEAHTALGEKTSHAIRNWTGPFFIGMTATGALIARHVTDLFPTQTSRFDLAQAARRGDIDVLVNAQLLAEGWNSPRATVCMHLAPTASKRIYQQRVGRVTRRHPGKESGIVVDFVHPATKHDDPVVTLHSLLDRDVYRGGAIVVGPVR